MRKRPYDMYVLCSMCSHLADLGFLLLLDGVRPLADGRFRSIDDDDDDDDDDDGDDGDGTFLLVEPEL